MYRYIHSYTHRYMYSSAARGRDVPLSPRSAAKTSAQAPKTSRRRADIVYYLMS